MREGLAREFPEAVRAAAWSRARLGVWNEPLVWATVSAIGASFLIGAVAQSVVGLTNQAFDALRSPMPFTLFPLATIAGTAAGAAAALAVGGPIALALYLLYVVLGLALGLPGLATFCERSGGVFPSALGPDRCTAIGFLTSLWPQVLGIGLGVAVARAIRARGEGINAVLRIAGGYAIAWFVLSHVLTGAVVQAQSAGALTSGLTIAAGIVASGVVAGVIAAQLPHGVRSAAVVAIISLLPWLAASLPLGLQGLARDGGPEYASAMLLTIAVPPLAAAFMVLSAAVASRARFIPRAPA
jgi:hypothetical protein